MKKIKNFIAENIRNICVYFIFIAFILLIFFFYDLNLEAFYMIFSVSCFILIIIYALKFVNYNKRLDLKEKIEELEWQIKALTDEKNSYREDLESYFLTWMHQVKIPISSIKIILESKDTANLKLLNEEIIRVENYINMSLAYLKLSNPSSDMDITHVDLDEIIKKIIKKYRSHFISERITLEYSSLNAKVNSDSRWLSIMIEQIMSNAVKYGAGAKVIISFDNEKSMLKVKDTGIGIKESDINKIFDKGYSGFNGRLEERSSGIGLYLAKLISKRLSHEISVDSIFGEFTEFTIKF